jgi:hypothetical protein
MQLVRTVIPLVSWLRVIVLSIPMMILRLLF